MKPALHLFPRAALALLICSLLALFELPATAEPLSLKHAIELALAHSPAAAQAGANQQRAFASYHEARNQYIPQMLVGSGLGNSWGYPLALEGSAPSLVSITAQSPLLNPALRDFVRAARTEYQATAEDTKDRRNQVIQDTVLTYLELVKWEKLIDHLHRQYEDADKMEQIVGQRVQEGVGQRTGDQTGPTYDGTRPPSRYSSAGRCGCLEYHALSTDGCAGFFSPD